MRTLRIDTARVFQPLLAPARYKGGWGGRGSGKSHFFAEKLVEDCLAEPGETQEGMRAVCIREVQKDLAQSSKLLIESKLQSLGIGEADGFKVYRDVIRTPGDGLMIFKGMQDYTADSIKSLEGFKRAWWEEAQSATAHSLAMLRPTLRAPGSELWFSWNARRKTDPVDVMLRGAEQPTGAVVVQANWRDNPWITGELEQERLDCLRMQPDQYGHIWEGEYISVMTGAYFARDIALAKTEGRIGRVAADPLLSMRVFCDIGGTGAKADAFAMWVCQFVGREIRVLDYYEAVGQPLATHLTWLRGKGYTPDKASIWLPHDGDTNDKVHDVSYRSAIEAAGYAATVIPNQGKGAAMMRVEALRRLFPLMWFNEATTQPGIDALGWYHEKRDSDRGIGLGPEHDWASHGCFKGCTQVLTRYGLRRIMDLPETGEVLTPCGWKQYINPRITKRDAQLVEVTFIGGYSVKCTPDHLFLTVAGWKSAESLSRNSVIQSTWTQSRSISMAVCTAYGQAIGILRAAGSACIGMFGAPRSEKYQPVAMCITAMGTPSTIGLRTWNAWTQQSIYRQRGTLAKSLDWLLTSISQRNAGKSLLNGIGQKRAGCGTKDMPSDKSHGLNGSVKRSLASIAGHLFRLSSERVETLASSAGRLARWLRTVLVAKHLSTHLRIDSVKQLRETCDVWDITVPDGHCFSLANGAVVHNSDAFGLMAVAYEAPSVRPLKIEYKRRQTA